MNYKPNPSVFFASVEMLRRWSVRSSCFSSLSSPSALLHFYVSCFQAANYLDIKGLLDVTCKTVANMIKGKTPEEIRKTFNIKNDFTEEEEAQVATDHPPPTCFKLNSLFISVIDNVLLFFFLPLFKVRKENQWCEEK